VFEGDGAIGEYVGGYNDWLWQRQSEDSRMIREVSQLRREACDETPAAKPGPGGKPRKLSYKDQRELEALPQRIEALEAEQAQLQRESSDPDFYKHPGEDITAALVRLEEVAAELEVCYARWETLE